MFQVFFEAGRWHHGWVLAGPLEEVGIPGDDEVGGVLPSQVDHVVVIGIA